MTIILLIRHGENEYVKKGRLAGRLPGVHLKNAGRIQVQTLVKKLNEAPIKAIYSSPLDRTKETAEPIANSLDLEVIPRAGLLEVDFGDWQDKTLKQLRRRKLWKVVQSAPSRIRFPGGESFAEAQLRIQSELSLLSQKHKPEDMVVCVTHSDIIKLAVAYFIGMPLDLFQRLHIAPASITALQISGTISRLINLNYEFSFTLTKK
jgi:probable phosphomutase (TIGR03848 family)